MVYFTYVYELQVCHKVREDRFLVKQTPKLSILHLTGFCSLPGVCLSAPFIYIGYNLFTNSTSGNHKNAKLLKDKQFQLRKVTGAVVAYSYPVNKQVEISLFCTRHLIGWI